MIVGSDVLADRPNAYALVAVVGLGSVITLLVLIFSDAVRDLAARRAVAQAQSQETATVDPLRKEGAE